MIRTVGVRSGVIEKTAIIESGRGHRRPVKETHGFRKFYQTTAIGNGMSPLHSEYLMGHHSGSLPVESYYRPSESDLLEGNDKMIGYVGAVDALLIRINDKLGLGLKDFQVNSSPTRMKEINQRLNSRGKSNLLIPLKDAQDPGDNTKNPPKDPGWLWILKDLRNQGMHRKLINIHTVASIHEHVNTGKSWSDKNRVYLIMNPQTTLEIIPYLEDSIMKTRDLAATIIGSEPLLKI